MDFVVVFYYFKKALGVNGSQQIRKKGVHINSTINIILPSFFFIQFYCLAFYAIVYAQHIHILQVFNIHVFLRKKDTENFYEFECTYGLCNLCESQLVVKKKIGIFTISYAIFSSLLLVYTSDTYYMTYANVRNMNIVQLFHYLPAHSHTNARSHNERRICTLI